jgi:hypothetical protein
MKHSINKPSVEETSRIKIEDIRVYTIQDKHPCGEDEPKKEDLNLDIIHQNQCGEGLLFLIFENKESGKEVFRITIEGGFIKFQRRACWPKLGREEMQTLCRTTLGASFLGQEDRRIERTPFVIPFGSITY